VKGQSIKFLLGLEWLVVFSECLLLDVFRAKGLLISFSAERSGHLPISFHTFRVYHLEKKKHAMGDDICHYAFSLAVEDGCLAIETGRLLQHVCSEQRWPLFLSCSWEGG